ncbi:MAG: hypothetical protein R6U91_09920 [Bacillota bacterium]
MLRSSQSSLNRKVRKKYDRVAPLYDFIDKVSTPHWMRKKAVSLASGVENLKGGIFKLIVATGD